MQNISDDGVLNKIYKSSRLGISAIDDMIPSVRDSAFLSDLRTQRAEYGAISAQAVSQLAAMGLEPARVPAAKKAGMKIATALNTAANSSTSHLADMMIQGSTMGITDITKAMNGYGGSDPQIKGLADRLTQFEQQCIDRLKTYL